MGNGEWGMGFGNPKILSCSRIHSSPCPLVPLSPCPLVPLSSLVSLVSLVPLSPCPLVLPCPLVSLVSLVSWSPLSPFLILQIVAMVCANTVDGDARADNGDTQSGCFDSKPLEFWRTLVISVRSRAKNQIENSIRRTQ